MLASLRPARLTVVRACLSSCRPFSPASRGLRSLVAPRRMSQQLSDALSKLDVMIGSATTPPAAAAASSSSSSSSSSSNGAGTAALAPAAAAAKAAPADGGSLQQLVYTLCKQAIVEAFPTMEDQEPLVAPCNQPQHGDYQCNNAMALFGRMKGKEGALKSPRAVAEAIVAAFPPNSLIDTISLAGPGFINIRVKKEWMAAHITSMLRDGITGWAPRGYAGMRALVDFSSPNVAKQMHVGHLRSTIIGDCLARTLEFSGADVLRLNHIGDWGTQFGMLIQYIAEKREGGLNASSDEDVADLQVLYRAAKARFDEDDEFKMRAREAVRELQSGNAEYYKAWQRICDVSRQDFLRIYARLGVQLQERGESFYNDQLQPVVDDLMQRGVAEESEGAKCIFVEGQTIPLIVQKSDGGFGYASTDMAAIHQRIHAEKADWIIYVTDVGQSTHFDMIFKAAKKAGYMPTDRQVRIDHVPFGLVMGEDGKKFRSRSGDVVRLEELLDEAKERTIAMIKERREDISDEELEAASSAMGYGAVKYADLKNHRTTNYRFSYDEMLAMQGNTAVYLLYAHARIASIVRKVGRDVSELSATASITLTHEKEVALALQIVRFSDAVDDVLRELLPSRICDYLYDLSGVFNQFYVECKVLGTPEEDSRLLLCEATAVVMRQCFYLLGIKPLYRI